MAANPFLFTEDEYNSPSSAGSNPFLMNDAAYQVETENPFFSQPTGGNSTNPFAFDPEELENTPYTVEAVVTTQTFSVTDSFGGNQTQNVSLSFAASVPDANVVQKPTDLDLKYTNTIAGHEDEGKKAPPPRPPPSKETQDLLMSVMGAMDATSSHLLDRIPPTRSPSPVSVRDIHSPSPTPEPVGDLLDVSDAKPQEQNLLMLDEDKKPELDTGLCDVNQNPSSIHASPAGSQHESRAGSQQGSRAGSQAGSRRTSQDQGRPPRPAPPGRPPRPQPPKPPPPTFANQVASPVQAPPKPPPPTVQSQPASEMFDMFGMDSTPPQKAKATKADILNLYNVPSKPETVDLLFDNVEPVVAEPITVPAKPVETTEVIPVAPVNVEENANNVENITPIAQEGFLSPQNDLQMDTSGSQSKESISSVTFNPFAAEETNTSRKDSTTSDTLQQNAINTVLDFKPADPFAETKAPEVSPFIESAFPQTRVEEVKPNDTFDAFAEKFESAAKEEVKNGAFDAFSNDAWGQGTDSGFNDGSSGFDGEESFDAFLALQEPPAAPQPTPNKMSKGGSEDSDEDKDFSVFIRPTEGSDLSGGIVPALAPPPVTPVQAAFNDTSPRFNPFDQSEVASTAIPSLEQALPLSDAYVPRTDSQETPPTPLFDEDMSQPLEPFPRVHCDKEGWEMHLRQPNKKKITGQRFWKKIYVCLVHQPDCVLLQLFNQQGDKDPFQELPLQPCYSVSDIGTQQYDQFGKIFTIKLQYIFYKERPGVRPGQVKKAERITNKLSQFAAYAMQGDYQGVKEFGSDLKKLGLPVEHAPQVSQLMKLGSLNYEDLKQFSVAIEEALFTLTAHRDRALHYKMEEVQITVVDELYVEQSAEGHIDRQIARVRLFFLGFLTGMPDVELGINDMRRQGKEVVGRHDIIPVVTEEWIRLEAVEFHSCVQQDDYNNTHIIKFKPPDACYIELLRFRIRPPKNRELPLQLKATICITGNKVELRADVLVPGFASRKLGQIPCEDVMIKFPIPECWIYMFRVEKHFRYGSVKSSHRRTGKIKGIERILGTVDTLQESLIEVTSGQAKYEHQHRAIVWRCPRLPKEGQGAYTTHNMVCRLALTSYDQMPEKLAEYCYVEFTMPATQASHTTVRSVSLQNSDSDEPPEKYVRYLARHEYRVGIEHTQGEGPNAYTVATIVKPATVHEEPAAPTAPAAPSSSSDSD